MRQLHKTNERHRTGIGFPTLCLSSIVCFRVFGFAGYRVHRSPGIPLGCIKLSLLLFGELFKGNELFHFHLLLSWLVVHRVQLYLEDCFQSMTCQLNGVLLSCLAFDVFLQIYFLQNKLEDIPLSWGLLIPKVAFFIIMLCLCNLRKRRKS